MLVLNRCRRPAALVLALCCSTSVAALAAQDAPAPNARQQAKGDFAFWAEMPDVAQVINDVQGKDEEDTAARQLAAYRLLNALVNANADRIGQLPWPPRERALYSAYARLIYTRVRPHESGLRDQRIMAQSYRFDTDTAFTQPFLKRYFSQAALRDIEPIVTMIEADAQRIGAADATDRAASGAAEPDPAVRVAAPAAHGAPVPPDQRRFAVAVNTWCRRFLTPEPTNPIARDQFQREASRQAADISRSVGLVRSWSGVLLGIESYTPVFRVRGEDASGANLVVSVDTAATVRVTQSGDSRPPAAFVNARVGSSSPMYAAAGRMQEGQWVVFSGRALEVDQWAAGGEPPSCRVDFKIVLTDLRPGR